MHSGGTRRNRVVVAAVVVGAMLLGVGCGGGDDDEDGADAATTEGTQSSTTSAPPSEEATADDPEGQAFLDEANAICEREFGAIDELPEPSSSDELAMVLQATRDHFQTTLDGLRGLTPPADLEADLEDGYAGVEDLIALLDDMVAAAQAGDTDEVDALFDQGQPTQDEVNDTFTGLGLDVCGAP